MEKLMLFSLVLSTGLGAQENKLKDGFQAELDLIGVGVSYEKAIAPSVTVKGSIRYGGGFFCLTLTK